jgi:Mg/Co/Ni transporter MgtE
MSIQTEFYCLKFTLYYEAFISDVLFEDLKKKEVYKIIVHTIIECALIAEFFSEVEEDQKEGLLQLVGNQGHTRQQVRFDRNHGQQHMNSDNIRHHLRSFP